MAVLRVQKYVSKEAATIFLMTCPVMKVAKGRTSLSMLAWSSALRYSVRSSTRITVQEQPPEASSTSIPTQTAMAVWVGMDVAKEPVVVAGFYTFILLCWYKFILLRHVECNAMQAGA